MTKEEIIHKITDSVGIVPLIEIVSDSELLELQIWTKQNSRMIEDGIKIQRRVAQNGGVHNLADLEAKNSFAGLYLRIVNDEVEKRKMRPKTIINHVDKSGNSGIIQEGDGNAATQNFVAKPEPIRKKQKKWYNGWLVKAIVVAILGILGYMVQQNFLKADKEIKQQKQESK